MKELDKEKKARMEVEVKNEELEDNLKQMIDDIEKTRDELRVCIDDNKSLA